jgi:hypothetical protein
MPAKQSKQVGPVETMIDGVNYHGNWQLSGDELKVSYGSWEESTTVIGASPSVDDTAKRLLTEIIDRDLTYRGRPPKPD